MADTSFLFNSEAESSDAKPLLCCLFLVRFRSYDFSTGEIQPKIVYQLHRAKKLKNNPQKSISQDSSHFDN